MGARTIDEGSLDEKSGMNFSEYVAILSGNTDLLEKARLDKKIAALESERKSFNNQNKAVSEHKRDNILRTIDGNNELIARMKTDWKDFSGRVQYESEGNKLNPLKLNGVENSDVKSLAAKLAHLNDNATTHREYYKIGTLYGFNLSVKTEDSTKEGLFMKQNRFFIEGEGNIKYSYNSCHIANDPKLSVCYFLHALERIPSLIEKYEKENAKIAGDLPVLQEIVNSAWRRENMLKDLKTEAAALDRKIQLSLKPLDESEDKKENNTQKNSVQQAKETMDDRVVPNSIPKYNNENQSKGFRL
jgi:hypothetical protein